MDLAVVFSLVLLTALLIAGWFVRPCFIVTRHELLQSIPPVFRTRSGDSASSKCPGLEPSAIRQFPPEKHPCRLALQHCRALRRTWPIFPPLPGRARAPVGNEEAANGEVHRTVVEAVNCLLERDDIMELREYTIQVLPLENKRMGASAEGLPDWSCETDSSRFSITTIEGKRPEVAAGYQFGDPLPNTMTLYWSEAGKDFKRSVHQENRYMEGREHPWGMLTFLAFYVVLYREGGVLYMTEAIPYDHKEPTIIMLLLFIVHSNYMHLLNKYGRLPPPPSLPHLEVAPLIRAVASTPPNLAPPPPTSTPSTSYPSTRLRRSLGNQPVKKKAVGMDSADPSTPRQTSSPESPLDLLRWDMLCASDVVLGVGRTGAVRLGRIDGLSVALKIVDQDAKNYEELAMELRNEFKVYQRLRPLWGDVVPRLVRFGACDQTCREILALEYLPAYPLKAESASDEVKTAAIAGLGRIHALGVKHGDLRESNILVVGSKPFFVDFGFSTLDASAVEREEEAAELQKLLGTE
ncbi:Protein kinase-like domain containing protein [Klebsormidium nitens]|uniref:Protein kinase-like domain containing protein n=1 Tax=Klebsormidium nitens TaxID=105231 RepID=A0A1Y1IY59_KLENI|nr:Protein kinase-like domain containing protein [Klebsormidium nitens]|eukprot:GAQ93248.1 Protein kinase-like domain containing protein [Klebsormidium nitens]